MRRRRTYAWAFTLYAVMFSVASAAATRLLERASGVNFPPHGTWDYVLGTIIFSVVGAFGVGVAHAFLRRRFDAIRFSKVAWSWVAILALFCILSVFSALADHGKNYLFLFSSGQLVAAALMTRTMTRKILEPAGYDLGVDGVGGRE